MLKIVPLLAISLLAATHAIAAAPNCNHYVNASMKGDGGSELIFADDEEIHTAHFVEQESGEKILKCVTYMVPGANGGDVIPTKCIQADTHRRVQSSVIHEFLGPTVGSPNVLLFGDAIWYSACGTDLQPYDGIHPFPVGRP